MNKSELISEISSRSHLDKTKVETFLNVFVDVITDTISNGEKVQLVGFGVFEKRHREPRVGRNPKTGEELTIPAVDVPVFRPGKAFKDSCNK